MSKPSLPKTSCLNAVRTWTSSQPVPWSYTQNQTCLLSFASSFSLSLHPVRQHSTRLCGNLICGAEDLIVSPLSTIEALLQADCEERESGWAESLLPTLSNDLWLSFAHYKD